MDAGVSQVVRRYNALLGGKDNFRADRDTAEQLVQAFPDARIAAMENRKFLRRVVRFLAADCGIRQFLDVGVGLPVSPNVHEIAQEVDPTSQVVYVDNDPLVGVHARALLTGTGEGRTAFVDGDLRRPDAILSDDRTRENLDFSAPVAVLVVAVLHFITDDDQPHQAVADLMVGMPAGSYLAVSHGTFDLIPADLLPGVRALTQDPANGTLAARTAAQVAAFADGLELVAPGVVPVTDWRPDREPRSQATAAQAACYGLLARKP